MRKGADRDAPRAILDAAASLLRSRGYEATTVRAIAAIVGIKAASIYHHYSSKDEIVVRVLNDGVRLVREAVATAVAALPAGTDPSVKLEAAIRTHLESSLQHSDYTSASIRAFGFLPDGVRARCLDERRAYDAVWQELVEQLRAGGRVPSELDGRALRLLLLGAVNWAGEWYRPGGLTIGAIARDFAGAVSRRPPTIPAAP